MTKNSIERSKVKNCVKACDARRIVHKPYTWLHTLLYIFLVSCTHMFVMLPFVKAEAYQVTFLMENDAFTFSDKDRYYTEGLKLSMSLPNFFELSVGQQIFNPNDKTASLINEDDRPYAGYLYVGLSKHFLNENSSNVRLRTAEITLGVVGPSSLGKEAQNNIHSVLGAHEANGWDYQIKDEFMFMLTFVQSISMNAHDIRNKKGGWNWDALPRLALNLGTPYTMLSAGGEVRFGWNLPIGFYTPIIRPGNGIRLQDPKGFSGYIFTALEGQGLLWNTFLDGNISGKKSPTVDKYPFVVDLLGGVALSYNRFTFAYTQTLRTKEFKGQDGTHLYGSFSMTYNF